MKKEKLDHRLNHKKRDQVCGTPIVTIFILCSGLFLEPSSLVDIFQISNVEVNIFF